jgi:hypothetical protein
MLSYLTPSSDSAFGICSTSLDEANKSLYQNEDDTDRFLNSYSYPIHHKSPIPFVYGHTSTSSYGLGLNFYDEISPFSLDTSRSSYTFIRTTKRSDPNIDVKLENIDLWKRFAELNLEMIITKTGR